MERIRNLLRKKFVQFFCTRPLVAFTGIMLALQAQSTLKARLTEMPVWTANILATLGYAAGIIALWVLFAKAPHLHFRKWMGWVLIAYWGVRSVGSTVRAVTVSDDVIEFTQQWSGFYGWSLVAILGAVMILAPNAYHLWDESYDPKYAKRR